jgi:hypothetical protein
MGLVYSKTIIYCGRFKDASRIEAPSSLFGLFAYPDNTLQLDHSLFLFFLFFVAWGGRGSANYN